MLQQPDWLTDEEFLAWINQLRDEEVLGYRRRVWLRLGSFLGMVALRFWWPVPLWSWAPKGWNIWHLQWWGWFAGHWTHYPLGLVAGIVLRSLAEVLSIIGVFWYGYLAIQENFFWQGVMLRYYLITKDSRAAMELAQYAGAFMLGHYLFSSDVANGDDSWWR